MKIEFPSEKVLEDYVYTKSREYGECVISGDAMDQIWRQMNIPGYGITDIVKAWFTPNSIELTVLELKNEPLKEAHVSQLMRYMKGLENMVSNYSERKLRVDVYGQLAGPFDPNKGDFAYMLAHLSQQVSVYELSLDVETGFYAEQIEADWRSQGEDRAWGDEKMQDLYTSHYLRFEELRSTKNEESQSNDTKLKAVK